MTALRSTLAELRASAADGTTASLLTDEAAALLAHLDRLYEAVLAASDIVSGDGDHHDNAEVVEKTAVEIRELGLV